MLFCLYKFFDILPDHVCLKVYGVSGLFKTEGGLAGCVRDDGHHEPLPLDLVDCETDPINGDGAFVDQVSQDLRGCLKGEERGLSCPLYGTDHADGIDMAGNEVAAKIVFILPAAFTRVTDTSHQTRLSLFKPFLERCLTLT